MGELHPVKVFVSELIIDGNYKRIRRELEKKNINVNAKIYNKGLKQGTNNGETLLTLAVKEGREKIVKILIDYKVNVDLRNEQGELPLDIIKTKCESYPNVKEYQTIKKLLEGEK